MDICSAFFSLICGSTLLQQGLSLSETIQQGLVRVRIHWPCVLITRESSDSIKDANGRQQEDKQHVCAWEMECGSGKGSNIRYL